MKPVPPVANFSYAMVNCPPLTVQFTDTSINSNGANYEWNFGDESSNTTLANPLHTFTSPGVYPVQETVSNTAGSSTKTQNVDVQYPSSNMNAGELQLWTFDASKVSECSKQHLHDYKKHPIYLKRESHVQFNIRFY